MTKFFNKFKKPCFGSFWFIFPNFGGKKFFFQKIRLCHAQLHVGFQHHAKIQKKLMIQFHENARTDGRTDRPYFIGPFRLPPEFQEGIKFAKSENKIQLNDVTDFVVMYTQCFGFLIVYFEHLVLNMLSGLVGQKKILKQLFLKFSYNMRKGLIMNSAYKSLPSEMFCTRGFLKNYAKIHRKTPVAECLF